MASAEIKDLIVSFYEHFGISSKAKDWKRLHKKITNGHIVRVFENKVIEKKCAALYEVQEGESEEADESGLFDFTGHLLFKAEQTPDGVLVSFRTEIYKAKNIIPDQHLSMFLEIVHGLDITFLSEECENQFVSDLSLYETISRLTSQGVIDE